MKKNDFLSVIELLETADKQVHAIYTMTEGTLSLINYVDIYHQIISKLISTALTAEGADYLYWWLYEAAEDNKILNWVEDDVKKTRELKTANDLYDYLLENNYFRKDAHDN